MSVLFDFERSKISVEDVVRHYRRGGDVRELVEYSKHHLMLALYLADELGKANESIWRELARKGLASPDNAAVYQALIVIHGYAGVGDASLILEAIPMAPREERMLAEICGILSGLDRDAITEILVVARRRGETLQIVGGLQDLLTPPSRDKIYQNLTGGDGIAKAFACALVCREFPRSSLAALMPAMVREDLDLDIRTRRDPPDKNYKE